MIRVYSKLDYEVVVKYGEYDLIIPARVYAMDIYDETKLGPLPKGIQVEYVDNPPPTPPTPPCSDPNCLHGIKWVELDENGQDLEETEEIENPEEESPQGEISDPVVEEEGD